MLGRQKQQLSTLSIWLSKRVARLEMANLFITRGLLKMEGLIKKDIMDVDLTKLGKRINMRVKDVKVFQPVGMG